ncbi:G2/mitotic-specific cyclin-A-like [Argiope bruennichi]|uniref:G2/mitotic-specific cyclin-A like protein n=1 Tax=Argiope bruennichi TaxID=94029 RepID=A0A8T0FNN3_ARGBR|nr:G2/mitotic-specific cyclin-A-like [Argiope bruennichi]KAF8791798.1 G2/mitotic-specific cyclin-A like protein [Argiope bruennichi]
MSWWFKVNGSEAESNGVLPRRPFVDLQNRCQEAPCCRQPKQQSVYLPEKENVCSIPQNEINRRNKRESIENFFTDPILLKEIYCTMKVAESKSCPLFRRSADKISTDMRSCFIDWLIYKAESFALDTATLHLAVHYADKYFYKEEAGVEDLPLIGSCAILLACKHEEARDRLPKVNDLIRHASNAFSRREVFQMEQKMLKALDFKMSYPTGYLFLQVFCSLLNIKDEEAFLAQYLCEIALIFEDVCFYTEPSKIAAASLISARYLLGIQPWFDDIVDISGYNIIELIVTSRLLCAKFDKIMVTEFKRVIAKYSSSKYKNISEKSYPNTIHI